MGISTRDFTLIPWTATIVAGLGNAAVEKMGLTLTEAKILVARPELWAPLSLLCTRFVSRARIGSAVAVGKARQ